MQEPLVSAAWASTTLGAMVCGPSRTVTVRASSKLASYLEFPDPGEFPAVVALLTKEAVRLPIGVVLDTDRPPESGSTVRIGNGTIVGEEGAWRPVRWWDPRPVVSIKSLFEHGHELMDLLDEQATSAFGLPKADAVTVAGDLARVPSGIALRLDRARPGTYPGRGRRRRRGDRRARPGRAPERGSEIRCLLVRPDPHDGSLGCPHRRGRRRSANTAGGERPGRPRRRRPVGTPSNRRGGSLRYRQGPPDVPSSCAWPAPLLPHRWRRPPGTLGGQLSLGDDGWANTSSCATGSIATRSS